MSRVVYLENWQEHLESTIEEVSAWTTTYSSSNEYHALVTELERLKELRRQVQEIPASERELVKSAVLALSVREPLQLSQELVQRLGELFDIYRRFRTKLQWTQ